MDREPLSATACVVRAHGQIDMYSAPTFQNALVAALDDGMDDLVVDLSGVDFIDSTGLGVLVGVSKRLRQMGGSMAIVSPDATIRRVFEITGLAKHFDIRG